MLRIPPRARRPHRNRRSSARIGAKRVSFACLGGEQSYACREKLLGKVVQQNPMRTASNPVPWQILLAIARGKSLSEAADMSGVDSGMGSRMISSLEADLRLTLLDRTTKPVKRLRRCLSVAPSRDGVP